jgi:hypothetical protein
MPRRSIEEVVKQNARELMKVPGVVGVAAGESLGRRCIKVFVVDRNSILPERIPASIEGYHVQIEESGEFRTIDT